MKRLTIIVAMALLCIKASAQDEKKKKETDTIRIGNILIIKDGKSKSKNADSTIMASPKKKSRLHTNWFIIDFGLSNYNDQTNYAGNTENYLATSATPATALTARDFKIRAGKSYNVNVWFFMQRLDLIKSNVSLKYGLGVELNNYRYKSPLSYKEGGNLPYTSGAQNEPFVFRDSVSFTKNKLAADYLTVPLMLSFSTNSVNGHKPLVLSVGISGGYLYAQRNKQKSEERGKEKNKGDYDMERFKLSYVAELGLGPVRLYGSYAPKSMYSRGLDIRPFNFGVRITNL